MTRREAREELFRMVFEMSFKTAEELDETLGYAREERMIDDEYIFISLVGIYDNIEYIDARISENAKSWKVERISKASMSAMRVAVYEMLYASLNYRIAINEAVELVKKYDDEKAPKFVNGILNKIAEAEGLKTANE